MYDHCLVYVQGLYFLGYETIKRTIRDTPNERLAPQHHMAAALTAGACTLAVTNPIVSYCHTPRVIYTILKRRRLASPDLGFIVPSKYMNRTYSLDRIIHMRRVMLSPISTHFVLSTPTRHEQLKTQPQWVIKTRMCLQVHTPNGTVGNYTGLWHALRTILRTEGVAGLYSGFVPGLFGTLHGAVQFVAYEVCHYQSLDICDAPFCPVFNTMSRHRSCLVFFMIS